MVKNSTDKRVNTRGRTLSPRAKTNLSGYMFLTPWLIGFFVFTLYPFIYSLYLSFTSYNVLTPPKWIGIKNYVEMLTEDPDFWHSFKVTCKFALIQVPVKLFFQLFVAVLLSKAKKFMRLIRTCFYVPTLVGGGVAVALTWGRIWGNNGAINQILESIGLPTVKWLADPRVALYILILLGVWQFGSGMLIFLAAIRDVPKNLLEAAEIDGASKTRSFWKITFPMITGSVFFNLVNGIIGSMQAFSSAFLITGGGPLKSTLYFGLYQYNIAFKSMEMGYASAMAWFLLLVIVALTAVVFKSNGAWVYYQDEM